MAEINRIGSASSCRCAWWHACVRVTSVSVPGMALVPFDALSRMALDSNASGCRVVGGGGSGSGSGSGSSQVVAVAVGSRDGHDHVLPACNLQTRRA
jgi:hypothetical protein